LTHHGADVWVLDTDRNKAMSDVIKPLRDEKSLSVYFCKTDVSKRTEVGKAIDKIVQKHGPPIILVNNAGIEFNDCGSLITMPYDKMRDILNTNLLGYTHMLRAVVPYMAKNRLGRIVNISSVQAVQSCLPGTSYQIAKSGILGLARVMALEYTKQNIRTNTILPGAIKTEGMGDARVNEDSHALDDLIKSIPIGRRGHPEEVANLALFLLSEGASYINGAELVVDGGLTQTLIGDMGIPKFPVINDPDKS